MYPPNTCFLWKMTVFIKTTMINILEYFLCVVHGSASGPCNNPLGWMLLFSQFADEKPRHREVVAFTQQFSHTTVFVGEVK